MLLIPSFSVDEAALAKLIAASPFGLDAFRMTALTGVSLPEFTNGVLWSLGLNVLTYAAASFWRPTNALERLQAAAFVGETHAPVGPTFRLARPSISVDELRSAVGRYLGDDRTHSSFAGFARAKGIVLDGPARADITSCATPSICWPPPSGRPLRGSHCRWSCAGATCRAGPP
jgi:hypothetical protein